MFTCCYFIVKRLKEEKMKKILSAFMALTMLLSLAGCSNSENNQAKQNAVNLSNVYEQYPDANTLKLSGSSAELNGTILKEYDYTWAFDPGERKEGPVGFPGEPPEGFKE